MTVPGWYDDPWQPGWLRWWDGQKWAPQVMPRTASFSGYGPQSLPLDAAVAAMKAADSEPWGARPVVTPLLAYLVLIVSGRVVSQNFAPRHGNGARVFDVLANVVLEVVLGYAVYRAGRDVARRNGGWGEAFGFRRPRWKDALPALAGVGIAFGLRLAIGIVAAAATNGKALEQSSNLKVNHIDGFTIALLIGVAAIAAPIVEETVFRGLFLRTFLRRMSFWPATILSSLIFGLGHTYEVDTLVGAITLAAIVGSMGLVNCALNRYTNSLVPGMIVHSTFNSLAILFIALHLGPH